MCPPNSRTSNPLPQSFSGLLTGDGRSQSSYRVKQASEKRNIYVSHKKNPFSLFFSVFPIHDINKFCIFALLNTKYHTMNTQAMTQQIAEYFKTQPVMKAWLFGSFARGEEREDSDVDVLVKFDRSMPIGLFAYIRMHRELEEKLGRKVDLVEEGTLRPAAQQTANRDLKVIYERNY